MLQRESLGNLCIVQVGPPFLALASQEIMQMQMLSIHPFTANSPRNCSTDIILLRQSKRDILAPRPSTEPAPDGEMIRYRWRMGTLPLFLLCIPPFRYAECLVSSTVPDNRMTVIHFTVSRANQWILTYHLQKLISIFENNSTNSTDEQDTRASRTMTM